MTIRILAFASLLLAFAPIGHAQILPFLGSNTDRVIDRPEFVGEPLELEGAVPAVVDLGFVSDRRPERRYAVAWLEKRLDNFGVGNPRLYVNAAVIDGHGSLVAGPQPLAWYSPEFQGAVPSNPAIAVDGANFFTVIWSVTERIGTGDDFDQRLVARTFWPFEDTRAGKAGNLCPADGLPVLDSWPNDPSTVVFDTAGVPDLSNEPGDFDLHSGILEGSPFDVETVIHVDAAASAAGRTVVVFPDHRGRPNWGVYAVGTVLDIVPLPQGENACEFETASLRDTPNAQLIAGDAEARVAPRVAINANNEFAAVAWRARSGAIRAQVLTPNGQLQGSPIEVAPRPDTVQESVHAPDVDFGPDGLFRVVWERNRYQDSGQGTPAISQILLSRFDLQGGAAESGVIVNTENDATPSLLTPRQFPRIQAADRDGDFAVAWRRAADQCPAVGGIGLFSASGNECGGGVAPSSAAVCKFQVALLGSFPAGRDGCRAGFRLAPHPATPGLGWANFKADKRIDWVDFEPKQFVDIDLDAQLSASTRNRCVYLEATGQTRPNRVTIEQQCGSGSCVTCEEQLIQQGLPVPEATEPPGPVPTAGEASAPRGTATAGGEVFIQWLQRDWQADDATPVPAFFANDQLRTGGLPALGMGRDGDMLLGWIDESADPGRLVTQNFASPVEIRINDVGILEAGQTRATANFTVTASKGYPVLPQDDCATAPTPSVSLLTADGSATFQAPTDYERTSGILDFGAGCGQAQEEPISLAFSVPVLDDEIFEGTESFFVNLFDEVNAIVVRRQGAGAIVDNEPPETVGFPSAQIEICEDGAEPANSEPRCAEGGGDGPGFVELRIALGERQEVEGLAEFQTFDGSSFGNIDGAQAGSDYEAVTGEVQFLPGVTEAFLSINLEDDGVAELDEQFVVELIEAENLTLAPDPAAPELTVAVTVTIIDDDVCARLPQWHLPDPAVDPRVPPLGTDEERTGYFCVTNPEGFAACPWRSELVLDGPQAPWLTLTDLRFDQDPTDPAVVAAQGVCQNVPGTTGAIRYIAAPNEPPSTGQPVQSRRQTVAFLNGLQEPETRDVEQTGGDCDAVVDPAQVEFFPAGGEVDIDISFGGDPACEFIAWTAQPEDPWLSLEGADGSGRVTGGGPAPIRIRVAPFDTDPGAQTQRIGTVDVNGVDVTIVQEAPLFDHFDDGVVPDPVGWLYTRPDAWSEAGTHLSADTMPSARILAASAFPGCSDCELTTSVRFDTFGKGTATVYMWWRSEDHFLALTVDEFFDSWTLTQRVGGVDHELRRFTSDVLVGDEYSVRMAFEEIQGQPLILVDIDGSAMCPAPGPGLDACEVYAIPSTGEPVVGSGTVGLAAEGGRVSFNLLRVLRADAPDTPLPPVDLVFASGFESTAMGSR